MLGVGPAAGCWGWGYYYYSSSTNMESRCTSSCGCGLWQAGGRPAETTTTILAPLLLPTTTTTTTTTTSTTPPSTLVGVLRLHPPHPEGLKTPLDTQGWNLFDCCWRPKAACTIMRCKCKWWPKAVCTIPSPGIPVQDLSILHAGCLLWGGLSALYSLPLLFSLVWL